MLPPHPRAAEPEMRRPSRTPQRPRRGRFLALALILALPHLAAAGDLPIAAEMLPPLPLRPAWEAAGRPVVVILPDHLGLDARAGFHAEALLAQGLSVLAVG